MDARSMVTCVLLLVGCATPRDPVEIDETGVVGFNVRATLPFGDQEKRAALAEGRPEDGVGSHSSLEFELTYQGEEAEQTLDAADSIELDRNVFDGPGEVDYRFQVIAFALSGQAMRVYETGLAFGGFAGISSHTLDLDARFLGARDSVDVQSFGPYLGTEVAWYAPAPLHLFARLTFSYELADERDTVETHGLELGGVYHFGRHVSLGAGWRWWSYEAEDDTGSESDLELDVNGPLLTLGFAP